MPYPKKIYSTQNRYILPRERFLLIDKILSKEELWTFDSHKVLYFISLSKDREKFLNWLETISIFNCNPHKSTCEINYGLIEDELLKFKAECDFKEIGISKISFKSSLGLWIAIDDIFHRLMCSGDFLSYNDKDERNHIETECSWFKYGGIFPKVRYFDYQPIIGLNGDDYGVNLTDISWLYSCIPNDSERIQLGRFMCHIGMTWIHLHEHGHFVNGHCHFYNKVNNSFESISEIDINDNDVANDLNRYFEYQSDMHALGYTVNTFFRKEFLDHVPTYCTGNKTIWLLRIIIQSMTVVLMLIQKNQEYSGSSNTYPKAISRITGIIFGSILESLKVHNSSRLTLKNEDVPALIHLISWELFGASEIIYSSTDQIRELNYNFKEDYKPLNIFDDMTDIETYQNGLHSCLIDCDKVRKVVGEKYYERYFKEFIELEHNANAEQIFNMMAEFRKMATNPLSIFKE